MKIADILLFENEYPTAIILHKEDMFWRAYEKSAYLFSRYILPYNFTKKYYKIVNDYIVYLGFPQNNLGKIHGKANNKNQINGTI